MALLTRSDIENALRRLGELALQQDETIELLVVGGAAMVLGYDARLATHDVDAVALQPESARLVRSLVQQVAEPSQALKARYAFLDLWESVYGDD